MRRQNSADPLDEEIRKLEQEVQPRLETLRFEPRRNAEAAARARTAYLSQARSLAAQSQTADSRPTWWIQLGRLLAPANRPAWAPVVAALMVALVFILGSTGFTVFAAQNSLPGETLYPVKIWSEDTRLEWAGSQDAQLNLLIRFISQRFEEIDALQQAQKPIPAITFERLNEQTETALQFSAGLEDAALAPALNLIQRTLRAGEAALGPGSGQTAQDPALVQARTRLQAQLRLVELGLEDPQTFRLALRQRHTPQDVTPGQPGTDPAQDDPQPGVGSPNGDEPNGPAGPQSTSAPGNGTNPEPDQPGKGGTETPEQGPGEGQGSGEAPGEPPAGGGPNGPAGTPNPGEQPGQNNDGNQGDSNNSNPDSNSEEEPNGADGHYSSSGSGRR